MKGQQWILGVTALAIMAGAGGVILRLKSTQRLGQPGLRVSGLADGGPGAVELPPAVLDCVSSAQPITPAEVGALPKDTTFGRRLYQAPDGFTALASVVMMGADRTSIHKPQFCLTGQGWIIHQTELTDIAIRQPHPYRLPVMKLTTSKTVEMNGQPAPLRGIYVYWFVAENRLTARHWQRMWWMAGDLIRTGVLERWAYVTFFAVCQPGQEAATFDRLSRIIAAAVPEFQLAAGPREAGLDATPAVAPGAGAKR